MQRRRLADRRNSEKTNLSLLTQALKSRHHLAKYLPNTERRSVFCFGNRIVQVKDIDAINAAVEFRAQAAEASSKRSRALRKPYVGVSFVQVLMLWVGSPPSFDGLTDAVRSLGPRVRVAIRLHVTSILRRSPT